jgi:beta-lactam-binding protein with PASTA domain
VDLVVASIPMAVVPDVVGDSQEEAATKLAQEGLRVGDAEYVYDKNVDAGFVVSQEPAADKEVVVASEVNLVISKGEETGQVPNVVGLSQDDAIATLEAAGFKVETEMAHSESVEAGDVIAQSPEAGKTVSAGSTVTITVSTGAAAAEAPATPAPVEPAPETPATPADPKPEEPSTPDPGTPEAELVTVPNVVGKGILQAIVDIRTAKLKVKFGWVADDANVFKVSAQKPPAGEKVDPGTTVTIEIGLPAFLFDLQLPSEFPTATPQPLPAPVEPGSAEPSATTGG